jgi:DNA primase large subunit
LKGDELLTFAKYPYLAEFPGYLVKSYGYPVTLRDLAEDFRVVENARRRLREAIEKGEVSVTEASAEDEVSAFYLAAAIVSKSQSTRLAELLAEAESKRARKLLEDEDREALLAIARSLGLRASKADLKVPWTMRQGRTFYRTLSFSVSVADYLRVVAQLNDPRWSLVNSMVKGGLVYMDDGTFRDFLSLAIARRIKDIIRTIQGDDSLGPYVDEALRLLAAKEAKVPIASSLDVNLFPPCMKELAPNPRSKGDRGLYAYLSFIASIGAPLEVLTSEISRALEVPSERAKAFAKALLASGLGTKYRPYTCDVMRQYGLCPVDCGSKTPLQAYRRLARSPLGSRAEAGAQRASPASATHP